MDLDRFYIGGITTALCDLGITKIANFRGVIEKVAVDAAASQGAPPPPADPQAAAAPPPPAAPAGPAGAGMAQQATPVELQYVANSGLTEGDIQAAAKVIQVIAEMKQQVDVAMQSAQQGQGGGQQAQQPPLPPPPQPPGQPPQG